MSGKEKTRGKEDRVGEGKRRLKTRRNQPPESWLAATPFVFLASLSQRIRRPPYLVIARPFVFWNTNEGSWYRREGILTAVDIFPVEGSALWKGRAHVEYGIHIDYIEPQ